MELREWWPWYERISKLLELNELMDQYATDVLSSLLWNKGTPLSELRRIIEGKAVIVFGAGPSLGDDILRTKETLKGYTLIAADGAVSALLKLGKVIPHIIVSDLDGRINDIVMAHRLGSFPVIHAHGDNIEMLKVHVPKFKRALGTTQVKPRRNVYNFGGFTDGDRAVFLVDSIGARLVILAGMDFGKTIGPYSKNSIRSIRIKRLKLKIGKELLEWLASKTKMKLYNITYRGEDITGFERIKPEDLHDLTNI